MEVSFTVLELCPSIIMHTHTHSHLMALCLGLPRWAGTWKVKSICILLKQETVSGSGISWAICKSAPCSRQITNNHAKTPPLSFLQAGCPSCHLTTASKHWRQKYYCELLQYWMCGDNVQNCRTCTLCPQKSEPPKHFATATANLHRFKWNFTHTRRHLFLASTSNFARIPYSVYEMFNSFKLLSQISVSDTTYFLLTSSVVTGVTSVRVDKQTTCYQKRIEF